MKCQCNKYDRLLTEQYICWHNDNRMIDEILSEVATLEDIEDAMSKCVLLWMHRVEVQRHKNQPFMT